MPKKLNYKGTFNWHGEIHTIYRHGINKEHAKEMMLMALGKKLDRHFPLLRIYFDGSKDNFKIEEVKR